MSDTNKVCKINFKDGTHMRLDLGKIVHTNNKKEAIYFDKVSNNRWRVIVSESVIPNFNDISDITFE